MSFDRWGFGTEQDRAEGRGKRFLLTSHVESRDREIGPCASEELGR